MRKLSQTEELVKILGRMFRRPSLPQLVGGLFHFLQQSIPVFRNKQAFYFINHLVRHKIKLNQFLHHGFLRQDIHHADEAYPDEHAGHPVRQQGNLVHQHVRQTAQAHQAGRSEAVFGFQIGVGTAIALPI